MIKTVNGLTLNWAESHYRSRWKAVIIDEVRLHHHKGHSDCYIMVIIFDKSNYKMKRKIVKKYDKLWTTLIKPIDIEINCDWISSDYKINRY